MFAIAIFDKSKKRIYLTRDRLGIKPLYYAHTSDQFIFASEMKSILAHPDIHPDIDLISLNEYLSYEFVVRIFKAHF